LTVAGEVDVTSVAHESPMTTLNRITTFAPTAAKLAASGEEYLSAIKARHQEEAAARKEREVRQLSPSSFCFCCQASLLVTAAVASMLHCQAHGSPKV